MKFNFMKNIFSIVSLVVFLFVSTGQAESGKIKQRCGTPDVEPEKAKLIQKKIETLLTGAKAKQGQVDGFPSEGVVIPTVVHVIYSGSEGFLSEDDINSQISAMNDAYQGTGVQFELSDINYVENADWFLLSAYNEEMVREVKSALTVDSSMYLNLYTASLQNDLLGFATFPWDLEQAPDLDGVVILYSSFPGGSSVPYDEGDTAVHEIGHWLGLFHTFQPSRLQSGFYLPGGCLGPGDYVSDTPAERTPSGSCNDFRNTCIAHPGNDPIHNYMDYSPDACMDEFTPGQVARLQAILLAYRPDFFDAITKVRTDQ